MRSIKIFLSSVIIMMSGCSMPTAIVSPGPGPVTSLKDWAGQGLPESMKTNENTGFHYDFEYDHSNLYVKLATSDPDVIRKIVYFGFTIWVDRTGGKEQKQGFRYPKGARISPDQRPVRGTTAPAGLTQPSLAASTVEDLNSLLGRADEIDLIGIYGTAVRSVKMRDSPIRARTGTVGDILVYEAVIPFEMLEFGYSPVTSGANISIGLETGRFQAPSAQNRQRPLQGSRTGDGNYPPGGVAGRYPGQYSGRMPDRAMMDSRSADMGGLSRPTRLWVTLEFAR